VIRAGHYGKNWVRRLASICSALIDRLKASLQTYDAFIEHCKEAFNENDLA
jgi:hypothetical protein